jgi:hypothetical protein
VNTEKAACPAALVIFKIHGNRQNQPLKIPAMMLMIFQIDPITCHAINTNKTADATVATVSISTPPVPLR